MAALYYQGYTKIDETIESMRKSIRGKSLTAGECPSFGAALWGLITGDASNNEARGAALTARKEERDLLYCWERMYQIRGKSPDEEIGFSTDPVTGAIDITRLKNGLAAAERRLKLKPPAAPPDWGDNERYDKYDDYKNRVIKQWDDIEAGLANPSTQTITIQSPPQQPPAPQQQPPAPPQSPPQTTQTSTPTGPSAGGTGGGGTGGQSRSHHGSLRMQHASLTTTPDMPGERVTPKATMASRHPGTGFGGRRPGAGFKKGPGF